MFSRKMSFCICLICSFIVVQSMYSQEKVLGVMDLTAKAGVSESDASIVTEFLFDSIFKYAKDDYKIIARSQREALLEEIAVAHSGLCDEQSCAVEYGRYLAADYMVVGSFKKFGSSYYLTLKLVNVGTTEVEGSENIQITDYDHAVDAVHSGVQRLFGSPAAAYADNTTDAGTTESTGESEAVQTDYSVGDIGPAGGWVFYDKGEFTDGWRYLECAPYEQGRYLWGRNVYFHNDLSSSVGSGENNTRKIVQKIGTWNSGKYAAKICDSLVINGFDDWFLPSKDELNLIYWNLYKQNIGNLEGQTAYWSSTEDGITTSYCQYFATGSRSVEIKNDVWPSSKLRVRAVRAF